MLFPMRRAAAVVLYIALVSSAPLVPAFARRTAKHDAPISSARGLDPLLREAMRHAPTATQYPNNNYACLLDLGYVTVKPEGTVIAEYRLTYRLFNDRARDIAEVSIPYNAGYQKVEILHARTIRRDGSIQDVRRQDIRKQSAYSDFALYADNMNVGFSMPGVENGCIIDYAWRLTTRPILPGHFFDTWAFSDTNPKSLSRLVLRVPVGRAFAYRMHNDDRLKPAVALSKDGKTKTYRWERRNLPPIQEEPSMPEGAEVHTWLSLSSIPSWQEMARWYGELARPQASASARIRANLNGVIAGKTTDAEKARAVYDWVANRVRYVGLEFGISAYRPHTATQVYDNLYGDCKDKATLLIAMLGLAGIKAYPVLLNTGTKRLLRDEPPTLNAFDHCIALAVVDGREVWLDATAETCAYGDIPGEDRGADALVIRGGTGRFQTIPAYAPEENGTDIQTRAALKPDGSAEMSMVIQLRGATAQRVRAQMRSMTPEQRQIAAGSLAQVFASGANLRDFNLPDETNKEGPYTIHMTLQAPRCARKVGRLLLLPMAAANGAGAERQNPFIKETRIWPIVVQEASLTRADTTYTLPVEYDVDEIPDNIHLTGPLNEYSRRVDVTVDRRSIEVHEMNTSRAGRVVAADYGKLRAYFNDAVKATEDWMVLRRTR